MARPSIVSACNEEGREEGPAVAVEIILAKALQMHTEAPDSFAAEADTVRAAIEQLAAAHPHLRAFILDDQGRLRRHVNIFRNNAQIEDRAGLGDRLADGDRLHVLPAVSGGSTDG